MAGGAHQNERHSPLVISLLEPTLLVLLKEKPQHGYTLLANLDRMGISTIHPSVIYRTLREMEDLDWIASTWDMDQTQGPPRRTYQLTSTGHQVLQNWRQELIRAQDLILRLLEPQT
jgi:DNA-binding PadR family transcriptional regulator